MARAFRDISADELARGLNVFSHVSQLTFCITVTPSSRFLTANSRPVAFICGNRGPSVTPRARSVNCQKYMATTGQYSGFRLLRLMRRTCWVSFPGLCVKCELVPLLVHWATFKLAEVGKKLLLAGVSGRS